MVRAPCCEKMGLKRGPWTHEEDQILIRHINLHGHGNWRALPKQAGLLRCGKSCRLRWTNYLRPDIKRGNFSKEEEETIIELHGLLGNRWSAIATRLSGRTDNEIKNVWHTHLKKRVMIKQNQNATILTKRSNSIKMEIYNHITEKEPELMNDSSQLRLESPQHSSSDVSLSSITNAATISACTNAGAFQDFPEVDQNFWSDLFLDDGYGVMSGFPVAGMLSGFPVATATAGSDPQVRFQLSPLHEVENVCGCINSNEHEGLDFWYNLFTTAG